MAFPSNVVCQGLRKDGEPCNARRRIKISSLYCRDSHAPDVVTIDPALLRIPKLRQKMKDVVLAYRDNTDVYMSEEINSIKEHDLDHVFELHLITGCIGKLDLPTKNTASLTDFMRNHAINERENLAFTKTKVNLDKYKACDRFFTDYKSEKTISQGLFSYLQDETVGKLSRRVSGNIQNEIANAYDSISDSLQSENKDQMQLLNEMHSLFLSMKLK
jgi:hypothetical protein